MNMKILVTGGAGFIGSNLCRRLLKDGHDVSIIDNFSTGRWENIDDIKNDMTIYDGDMNDTGLIQQAFQGTRYIFHEAAVPSVARSVENPMISNYNNIDGTLNVLWNARKADVQRVIFASSSSIYGDTPVLPKQETMTANPQSPYALSKYAGEVYCRIFSGIYGLETVCLRYFNVFGPYQNPFSDYAAVIPKFLYSMKRGDSPVIFGDGTQTRDFCYIDNVVEANVLALSCKQADGHGMNIGCGERISLLELVEELNFLLGTSLKPQFMKPRSGDVRDSLASIETARKILGYEPLVKVRDGLKKLLDWSNP